jgi:hypothetical protein
MSARASEAHLRDLEDHITTWRPHDRITLHRFVNLYDFDEHLDRANEIYGPQVDNSAPLGPDMCATLTNFYPEKITAYYVWWRDSQAMFVSESHDMFPGDTMQVDLRKLQVTAA